MYLKVLLLCCKGFEMMEFLLFTICQSKLIEVLSRTIKDGEAISLVHKYLNAGVME